MPLKPLFTEQTEGETNNRNRAEKDIKEDKKSFWSSLSSLYNFIRYRIPALL